MSLEDLDSDFQSDESDYEVDKNSSDGEKDDDDVSNYLELVHLYINLMCFQHIYNNNAIIDMQYTESEAEPSDDSDSVGLELALTNYIDNVFEDVFSTNSSSSSSVASPEDGSTSNTDDSALSCIQDFVQLHEEVTSTSSSSSSAASDVADGQMTNADDTNAVRGGVAEGQL